MRFIPLITAAALLFAGCKKNDTSSPDKPVPAANGGKPANPVGETTNGGKPANAAVETTNGGKADPVANGGKPANAAGVTTNDGKAAEPVGEPTNHGKAADPVGGNDEGKSVGDNKPNALSANVRPVGKGAKSAPVKREAVSPLAHGDVDKVMAMVNKNCAAMKLAVRATPADQAKLRKIINIESLFTTAQVASLPLPHQQHARVLARSAAGYCLRQEVAKINAAAAKVVEEHLKQTSTEDSDMMGKVLNAVYKNCATMKAAVQANPADLKKAINPENLFPTAQVESLPIDQQQRGRVLATSAVRYCLRQEVAKISPAAANVVEEYMTQNGSQ